MEDNSWFQQRIIEYRGWVERNSKDDTKVNVTFKGSQELKIIKDLFNNGRRGYGTNRRENTGKFPRIDNINTIMRMTTKPERCSLGGLTLNRRSVPEIMGDGNAKVIITGDILRQGRE